ncbi:E3 ubiquitin-protein ligase SlrP-like [Chrysoperla carnea]|uniref:E3 ubiquitin-protein ligase SlrP-like n=1 Tax=Chrysoperla carnea TaxID=189513 RepID=UPI001D090A16|nr:E3 ubiquitin-protein ligase SlrP-like [Chrysoperla carnea]
MDESYFKVWELWKSEQNQNEDEERAEAFVKIMNITEPWDLYLEYMNLSTIPNAFPYTLRNLILRANKLIQIPEYLPETLELLDMGYNELCSISENLPSNLQELYLDGNNIPIVPETLPNSIKCLDLSRNIITTLSNKLPKNLKILIVSYNLLSCVSENLTKSLKSLQILVMGMNNLSHVKFDSDSIIELNLSHNNIKIIEYFNLPRLQSLDVENNKLICLPNLSETLEFLDASQNNLSVIEKLPKSLISLDLRENKITTVPKTLPPQLKELWLCDNKLVELSLELPPSLVALWVTNNVIEDVTLNIEDVPNAKINLENNPISETTREYLQQFIHIENPPNVSFDGSWEYYENFIKMRPLIEEISYWLDEELIHPRWDIISEETGSRSFSYFLYEIRHSYIFENHQLKEDISKWLCSLGEDSASKQKLREMIFLMTEEEVEGGRCFIRINWTLNQMKLIEIAFDVESGTYDNKIEELMKLARGMFRLNILDQISRKTVQNKPDSLRHLDDEIRIYLEYQIRLKNSFELPINSWKLDEVLSDLPNGHIEEAIKEIHDREENEFIDYLLIDWQPWKEVLKRWNFAKFIISENDVKNEELFHVIFDKLKTEFLNETSMSELPIEVEIQLGKQVQRNIAKDIWYTLTNEFLATKKLSLEALIK